MNFRRPLTLLALAASFLGARSAWAIPTLQLDIVGGIYNTTTETTVATGPIFTLRALLNTTSPNFSRVYSISAAIEPQLAQLPVPNFGNFTVDGVLFSATNNTQWGRPPVDVLDTSSGNLPMHGMFPTYYGEIDFTFDSAHTVASYNTADHTSSPGTLYYHDFVINATGLLNPYDVHFDLYDEAVKKGVATMDDFAPFSHDAESGHYNQVPDSSATMVLVGLGLGALIYGRHLSRSRR